ncbi:MAG: GNAT family N-acetyltransferase [Lachnospiraceae bacterium]|nr:GNAT family N-acetyltransferase [Lachnospiraceae bacterium]
MNTITYRKAVLEDCLDLAILKGQVWNTTYKGIYSEEKLSGYDIAKNESIFQNIVNNPDIELFVALDNQKIVGLMTCGKPYRPFMDFQQEIGLLYILKEYQRKGIGKTFFEIARNQVKANGYTKLFLSVNSKNFDAQKFYEAMGGVTIYQDEVSIKYIYQV